MDHVLSVSTWYGNANIRLKRARRCAPPTRADLAPDEGFPFRMHHWLQQLPPAFAASAATLQPAHTRASAPPPASKLAAPLDAARLLRGGPSVALRSYQSETERRDEWTSLPSRHRNVRLLHVSMRDVGVFLGCVKSLSEHHRLGQLLGSLFNQLSWCFRPEEMTEPRRTAANETIDVCVWGFRKVLPPPWLATCGRELILKEREGEARHQGG